jgi:hypothetical protein
MTDGTGKEDLIRDPARPFKEVAEPKDPVDSDGGDGSSAVNGEPTATPDVPAKSAAEVALESLAPRYDEARHQTYLARLNAAVDDETSRNVALTGRYG